VRFITYYFYLE